MTAARENPFAGHGNIVSGDRFVGRLEGLRAIDTRVLQPTEPGNLAIVGQPRIGKSSLAYQGIMARGQELLKNKVVPVWMNLAIFDGASDVFREFVIGCQGGLGLLGSTIPSIDEETVKEALQVGASRADSYRSIQRYFQKVRESGVRVVVVLDEFDHARHLFKDDISGFQMLRELSYRPEWRVTLVTTSRRAIRDIELQARSISTLDGIFLKHYVEPFLEPDLDQYFSRLDSAGMSFTGKQREGFAYYCGGIPYLLDVLGYKVADRALPDGGIDLEEAAQAIQQQFIEHYDHLIDHLREDETLSAALQVLFGPSFDATQAQINELRQYGMIHRRPDGTYAGFSAHFEDYLRLIARTVDIWPTWQATELALRRIVGSKLIEQYGDDWVRKLERSRPNLKSIFEECKRAHQREQAQFGERASSRLVDYTYPMDLFSIIFAEWATFSSVFGKDKAYWSQRAQFLGKVRTPLSHNRVETLNDYERQIIEGYCKEILAVLDSEV